MYDDAPFSPVLDGASVTWLELEDGGWRYWYEWDGVTLYRRWGCDGCEVLAIQEEWREAE